MLTLGLQITYLYVLKKVEIPLRAVISLTFEKSFGPIESPEMPFEV